MFTASLYICVRFLQNAITMINAIIWNVDPVIIDGFFLRWYSLLFAMGFFLPYMVLSKVVFPKENRTIAELDTLTFYAFLGTLLGARIGHFLFYDPSFIFTKPLEVLLPFEGIHSKEPFQFVGYQGLASHGGALGLLVAFYFASKKTKLNYFWILSRVAIIIPLAGACIRFGNLMNSEIYGHATDLPWGMIFERNNEEIPKHPTQLYEALSYLAIFGFIVLYYLKSMKKKTTSYFMLIGILLTPLFAARFFIEFVKENQEAFEENMVLNMGQYLSIPFVIAGLVCLWMGYKKKDDAVIRFFSKKHLSDKK